MEVSHDLRVAPLGGRSSDHLPTVMFGGVSLLSLLIGDPSYTENPLRQDFWRAGHAHAGVWLILALVALRYVDEAKLSNAMKRLVRGAIPIAAILVRRRSSCRFCRPMPKPRMVSFIWPMSVQRCSRSACWSSASASLDVGMRNFLNRLNGQF